VYYCSALQCVAGYRSVLHYVAVCVRDFSSSAFLSRVLLQCVAVCCSVLQCVEVCCSVLQCVALCCSVLQCVAVRRVLQLAAVCCSVLQCVAVCCSVLQCAAVCCSVLQCVAVCCSALQCVAVGVSQECSREWCACGILIFVLFRFFCSVIQFLLQCLHCKKMHYFAAWCSVFAA